MTTETLRLYFEDETKRIPCGWRTVDVKRGRKWAYFLDKSNGNSFRLPLEKADAVIKSSADALAKYEEYKWHDIR